ncbi:8846_t:CDS:2, partial [Acaulospora morrowiae]
SITENTSAGTNGAGGDSVGRKKQCILHYFPTSVTRESMDLSAPQLPVTYYCCVPI